MSNKLGDAGGVAIGEEAVAYGTLSTAMVWQHARSAGLGRRAAMLDLPRLSAQALTTRKYSTGYSDGEVELAHDNSRAVIGPVLASCGALSTDDYVIGDGSAPDTESVSAQVMLGNDAADGYMTQHLGCVPTHLRCALAANQPVVLTLGLLGQGGTEVTAVTPSPASEAGIVYESDFTTITIGGVSMCVLQADIESQFQVIGADRKCLATSVIKKPTRTTRVITTAQLMVELSDDTGADSEALLALWHAGTALGDIVIGDMELGSCYMLGDPPSLASGIIQFPINVEANAWTITTVA